MKISESSTARALIILALVFIVASSSSFAQEAGEYFKVNCVSCHTIGGGRLIGPDLKNVTERRDRNLLIKFMLNPKAMIDSGDPYMLKLLAESKGVVMLTIPTLNSERAGAMLDLIEAESKLEVSQFVGMNFAAAALTDAEVRRGRKLYAGLQALNNGGPPCVSCHTVNIPGTGIGGSLGPNLTYVYNTMASNNALMAWLTAPPTTTMQSIFKRHTLMPDEIRSLVAFLESSSKSTNYNYDPFMLLLSVLLYGFGGAVIILVTFGNIWRRRFRSVRRVLVNNANKEVRLEKR